jgi:protein O-mannosyl-transferase
MPFVGLVLAVVWAGFLMLEKRAAKGDARAVWRSAIAASVVLLALYAYGTHVRNRIWRTEESLWLDDVQKCPRNGRGLMNYGLTQMAIGKYSVALDYFQRALIYTPNYPTLEINLGVVNGAMNRTAEAEQHFRRATALAPGDDSTHFFYGRWLFSAGRVADALPQLQTTVSLNPSRLDARDLLATAYDATGDHDHAVAVAEASLQLDPADAAAKAILAGHRGQTASDWINVSLYRYQAGDYRASIAAALQALRLDPQSAVAYNNIGAAYAGLKQWDHAIENERAALRIEPDFQLAKNNLALYTQMKNGETAPLSNAKADGWLNASLRDYQAHLYEQSIADARQALKLNPDYAEAYNNIAADDEEMHKWDDAIAAAREAIRLKPDFQLAKNNLAWSLQQKRLGVH